MHLERIAESTKSPWDNSHKRSKCERVMRCNHFSTFKAQPVQSIRQAGNDESNNKRETGIEPATIRAAIERSTTELPARRKDIDTPSAYKPPYGSPFPNTVDTTCTNQSLKGSTPTRTITASKYICCLHSHCCIHFHYRATCMCSITRFTSNETKQPR